MATFTQLGFKLVFKKPCIFSIEHPIDDSSVKEQKLYILPETINGKTTAIKSGSGADQRMIFPPGILPSNKIRYSIYAENHPEDTGGQAAQLSATSALLTRGFFPLSVLDVTFQRSAIVFAITCFNGVDVIDLDEKNFKRTKDGIKVSHNIFRVIYAGTSPLVPSEKERKEMGKETEGIDYWITIGPYLSSNLSQGTTLSNDAPFDVKNYYESYSGKNKFFADTASNTIKAESPSSIKYVSYIGIDKPIFRDLVILVASSQSTEVGMSGSTLTISPRVESSRTARILRFSWINTSENEKEETYQWRLSESFGFSPQKIAENPGTQNYDNDVTNHYVYNLNDSTYPDWESLPAPNIYKTAYYPSHAKELMNPSSYYYDPSFNFSILEQDYSPEIVRDIKDTKKTENNTKEEKNKSYVIFPNEYQFFPEGNPALLSGLNAICPSQLTRQQLAHSFSFTSPIIISSFGSNTRMGPEYYVNIRGSDFTTIKDFALLVKGIPGICLSSSYDPATQTSSLFEIKPIKDGSIATERTLDDNRWASGNKIFVPIFEKTKFLSGEYPFKTGGGAVFLPEQKEFLNSVSELSISLPQDALVTKVSLITEKDSISGDTFKLFVSSSDSEDPDIELTMGDVPPNETGAMLVSILPLNYKTFKTGGGFYGISSIWGAITNDQIAPTLIPYYDNLTSGAWLEYSDNQIKQMPMLSFPVDCQSISSIIDYVTGNTIVACENNGRIDLGIRSQYYGPFLPVRDVTLRIPDDDISTESKEEKVLPSVSKPYLVIDISTGVLYLFYIYKKKLIVKQIPEEIFKDINLNIQKNGYDPIYESIAIKTIHSTKSCLVYDGGGEGEDQQSILKDLQIGVIKDASTRSFVKDPEYIENYCAFCDNIGYLYSVIQTSERIVILRSPNLGDSWEQITDNELSFYPNKKVLINGVITTENDPDNTTIVEDRKKAKNPYVMIDMSIQSCIMFYCVESSLLCIKFPVEILQGDKEYISIILSEYIKPKLIFGKINMDMIKRGISPINSESSNKESNEGDNDIGIISQRITGIITQNGYYRIFFQDDKFKLRSMISNNLGSTWTFDEDFKL